MATLLYAEHVSSSLTSVTSSTVIDSSTVCTDESLTSLQGELLGHKHQYLQVGDG